MPQRRKVGTSSVLHAACMVAVLVALAAPAWAATLYASGTDWHTASHWGTFSGGADGAVPTSADDVIFDSNSASMSITSNNASCKTLVTTGTGSFGSTLTQGAGRTMRVYGAMTWSAGTFSGGDSQLRVDGAFTLSGGTFTLSSGDMDINSTCTLSVGTFTSTTGRLYVSGSFTNSLGAANFSNAGGTIRFDLGVATFHGAVLQGR